MKVTFYRVASCDFTWIRNQALKMGLDLITNKSTYSPGDSSQYEISLLVQGIMED